jgi:hypothetical protein
MSLLRGDLFMAYTPRNSGSSSGSSYSKPVAHKPEASAAKSDALFSSGLFTPDNEKSKAIGTVRVKETITIPAGSYINLYENDRKKTDKDPVFKLQIREATKKLEV